MVSGGYRERLLSRKFLMAMVVVVLSFISMWTNTMSDSVAAQLVGASLAMFFGANVGSAAVQGKAERAAGGK